MYNFGFSVQPIRVLLPYREELIGDIQRSRWHGGVIDLIMDSVGMVGIANIISKADKLATIDLRIDYLQGA